MKLSKSKSKKKKVMEEKQTSKTQSPAENEGLSECSNILSLTPSLSNLEGTGRFIQMTPMSPQMFDVHGAFNVKTTR